MTTKDYTVKIGLLKEFDNVFSDRERPRKFSFRTGAGSPSSYKVCMRVHHSYRMGVGS